MWRAMNMLRHAASSILAPDLIGPCSAGRWPGMRHFFRPACKKKKNFRFVELGPKKPRQYWLSEGKPVDQLSGFAQLEALRIVACAIHYR